MCKLILFLGILFNITAAKSSENMTKLKYNNKGSVKENEEKFLKNLNLDCRDNGYNQKVDEISSNDVLATFPSEVAFFFFKKNIDKFCYYSFSTLVKYLFKGFKKQTEEIVLKTVSECLSNSKKYPLCEGINNTSRLFDLTVILGNYCSPSSLQVFKKINCQYKKVADKKCELYLGLEKGKDECPFHFTNKTEVIDLHKSFFGKHCRKYKWLPPKCLK